MVQHGGCRHGYLRDPPRAHHVAEVDHGIGEEFAVAAQDVVVCDVEVPRLHREVGHDRVERSNGPANCPFYRGANLGVRFIRQQGVDDSACMAQIPLEDASARGMLEALQRCAHPARKVSESFDDRGGKVARPGQGVAGDVLEHSSVNAPLRAVPPGPQSAPRSREDAGNPQGRLGYRDRIRRGILHADLGLAEHRITELEDTERHVGASREQTEVLVLLATERNRDDVDAKGQLAELFDLVDAEGRSRQFDMVEVVEQVGHGVSLQRPE